MELPGGEPLESLPGFYHGTAGGLVTPPSAQMHYAMTDGHCMLCLRHDTRPRPRGEKSMTGGGGGGINWGASPTASLSPRHCLGITHNVIYSFRKPNDTHAGSAFVMAKSFDALDVIVREPGRVMTIKCMNKVDKAEYNFISIYCYISSEQVAL